MSTLQADLGSVFILIIYLSYLSQSHHHHDTKRGESKKHISIYYQPEGWWQRDGKEGRGKQELPGKYLKSTEFYVWQHIICLFGWLLDCCLFSLPLPPPIYLGAIVSIYTLLLLFATWESDTKLSTSCGPDPWSWWGSWTRSVLEWGLMKIWLDLVLLQQVRLYWLIG